MQTSSITYNIKDYSNQELLQLLDLDDNEYISESDVTSAITDILQSVPNEKNTLEFQNFMSNVKTHLIHYIETIHELNANNEPTSTNEKNTTDATDTTNYVMNGYKQNIPKTNTIINRKDGSFIDVTNQNNHYSIIDKRLPIEQTYQVPIVRGQINPSLTNVHTRILHIDSQFRQDITKPSTDFTFDINEPLNKVTKLTLTGFEIHHSWYTFDNTYGTAAFFCENITTATSQVVSIPEGNYTPVELMNALNASCAAQIPTVDLSFSYNNNTGKTTITNTSLTDVYDITFYDSLLSTLSIYPELAGAKINANLGIQLGFKNYDATNSLKYTIMTNSSVVSNGIVDTYGPRYLILAIEEFNNNKVNNNIIGIQDNFTTLNMPSYFNCDLSLNNPLFLKLNDPISGLPIPSGLTTAQAYTITEILSQQKNTLDIKYSGGTSANSFARIPVFINDNFGVMISTTNNLKVNTRTYLGPVDITRMKVQLYNDKGQILHLNAGDFSFAIQIEQLYQY